MVYIPVKRPKVYYRNYLGPEWKPTYQGASTLVCNHQCWIDIIVMMTIKMPAFIAKMSVATTPVVGSLAKLIGTFFINRAGTREERHKVMESILARQQLAESG